MATSRTITLSDRPPVEITEELWPVIAEAKDSEHDGRGHESQANRKSQWSIRVRLNVEEEAPREPDAACRAIVYATYSYSTKYMDERDLCVRHGKFLKEGTAENICAAIREVADRMASCEHHEQDADRWSQLADECTADMPAEAVPE